MDLQQKTRAVPVNKHQPGTPRVIRATSSLEARWLMPFVDVLLAFASFGLAYYVRYELQIVRPVFELNAAPFEPYLPYVIVYTLWMLINYRGAGLYRQIRGRPWLEEVYIILSGAANATLVTMALSFFLRPVVFSRLMVIYVAGFTVVLLSLSRIVQRLMQGYLRSKGIGVQRTLIVGAGDVGQAVLRIMLARKELGYFPVGFVDDDPGRANVDLGRLKAMGNIERLRELVRQHSVDLVVITLGWEHHERIVGLVRAAQKAGAEVRVVPDLFQLNMKQVNVENLDGIPLLGVDTTVQFKPANRLLKRVVDMVLIVLASPVLILLFLLTMIAVRIDGPGPIFYANRRVGERGRHFNMIKFRSMVPDAEKMHRSLVETRELDPRRPKIQDDPRITRVGRFIRKFSLDELPNLINVLRGEMSLVGPRPPTPDEVELYESWHMQRLNIMPGITGLWQINGRSDVPFEEMCLLDIYYIENWSVKLDLQILFMTLPRVLLRRGAY
jgi:exopolysaccharide biosynthesis polyprenyl glycosylphosphotransferase